jgi:DNA-binding HxlR family transcriptional regulator
MTVSPRGTIQPDNPFNSDCPGRSLFETITNRWSLLILLALKEGPLRFHLLRDTIEGISERMLSQNLKLLVRDGLVERTVEPSVPPKTTYELTPIGLELANTMEGVTRWIAHRLPEVQAARGTFDSRM